MTLSRSRKRTRLAMVVVRSPTQQATAENLLEDRRRVQMELQTGDRRQVVVMASPDEVRAAMAARPTTGSAETQTPAPSVGTETQRRLLAYAQRARHVLARSDFLGRLDRTRRRELMVEIRHLKDTMQALQDEVEVTTRSVERMERLAAQLEQLTRDFLPRDNTERFRAISE